MAALSDHPVARGAAFRQPVRKARGPSVYHGRGRRAICRRLERTSVTNRVLGGSPGVRTCELDRAARASAPPQPACDPGNGGLTLPAGFCAKVIADDLGYARNLAVAANGDLYVSIRTGARAPGQPMQPGLPDGAARHRRRRHDGPEGAVRHQRRHRRGAAQRLPLLRDAALGRALQAHPGTARADRPGRGDRRRLPGAARPPGQGHRLRRQGQPLRDRRPAVERVRRSRSPARRQGPGSVPAARDRPAACGSSAPTRPGRRSRPSSATPPGCVRAWRSPGTTAISTWP